jgi:predicted outer membrane repeat protein
MTLTGGSFASNTADYGGGMYNAFKATVDGTTFQQNSASTAGGGIYQDGTFAPAPVQLQICTWVPGVVENPVSSRHLPDCGLSRAPSDCGCHTCAPVLLQS